MFKALNIVGLSFGLLMNTYNFTTCTPVPPSPVPAETLPARPSPQDIPTAEQPTSGVDNDDRDEANGPSPGTVPQIPNLPPVPPIPDLGNLPGPEDDDAPNEDDSAAPSVLAVDPPVVSPGLPVRITTDEPVFEKDELPTTGLDIGGQPALLLNAISPTEAYVMVPMADAGVADVLVTRPGGEVVAVGRVKVLPAPTLELVLRIGEGDVTLLGAYPRAGGHTEGAEEPGQPRIAFDVFSALGAHVAAGAVNHPVLGRREYPIVSDDGEVGLARVGAVGAPTLAIKIPNVPGAIVRFYTVRPNVDLHTAEGKASRKFFAEISLDTKGEKR